MALISPISEYRPSTDHLHYFKPVRAIISMVIILALGAALVRWGWFDARDGRTVLEGTILTLALLFLTARIFLPRTLSADGTEIRWTIRLRPPSRTAPRAQVRAIQFLTTTGPGRQRYYFVNGEGEALLWVDRFTPAEMLSFANYLGVQIRPVETLPPIVGAIDAANERWRAVGRKRAQVATFAVVGLIGLALTIFLAVVALRSVSEWSAYQRAGTCTDLPSDPLACRIETDATLTAVKPNQSWIGVDLRFSQDLLATGDHRSAFVWLPPGSHPQPALATGKTVTAEIFNRNYITALNGAYTRDYQTMKSNATWWYAAVPAIIPIVMGFLAYASSRGDVSGYVESDEERTKRMRSKRVSWPRWLRPVERAGSRLWIAWVG
jgi:hypothetical protein